VSITLAAGDIAPDFTLFDSLGNEHSLSKYRGKTVILYFYPKDDTPGCTKEACSFRDEFAVFKSIDAVILGVSTDDAVSHEKFRAKYELPFPLLVDDDKSVSTEYGSWGEKVLYGKKMIGMTRSTFIIGEDGKLIKVWKRARAEDHALAVLKALSS